MATISGMILQVVNGCKWPFLEIGGTSPKQILVGPLVGGLNPSEKYWSIDLNWDDYSQYMGK